MCFFYLFLVYFTIGPDISHPILATAKVGLPNGHAAFRASDFDILINVSRCIFHNYYVCIWYVLTNCSLGLKGPQNISWHNFWLQIFATCYLLHPETLRKYSFIMEFKVTGSDASSCCCLHDTRTQCCLDALSTYLKYGSCSLRQTKMSLADSELQTKSQGLDPQKVQFQFPHCPEGQSWHWRLCINPNGCSIGCTFLTQNEFEIVWLLSIFLWTWCLVKLKAQHLIFPNLSHPLIISFRHAFTTLIDISPLFDLLNISKLSNPIILSWTSGPTVSVSQGLANMEKTQVFFGGGSIGSHTFLHISINNDCLKDQTFFGPSHVETQLRSPLSALWPWLDAIATVPGDPFPEARPLFPHAPIVPSKPKHTQKCMVKNGASQA